MGRRRRCRGSENALRALSVVSGRLSGNAAPTTDNRQPTTRRGAAPMRLLQIDAFTDQPFRGNPAAVCLLDRERDEKWMQSVGAEMNLSETAFLLPQRAAWSLRWFPPPA